MRPKKQITIDLSSYLSDGTYNLYVKTRGTNVRESAESNSVECVVAPSGYQVTVSGVFEDWATTNLESKVTIDNITCSVDYLGNMTNIPHTFTNVTTFEIKPTDNSYGCVCEIISGSGTYINGDYLDGHAYQAGDVIRDVGYTRIIITMTSDTVIKLGYYEN